MGKLCSSASKREKKKSLPETEKKRQSCLLVAYQK